MKNLMKKVLALAIMISTTILAVSCGSTATPPNNPASGGGGSGGSGGGSQNNSFIINHTNAQWADLQAIPLADVNNVSNLKIVYWHTSHGQQLISGLTDIAELRGSNYELSKLHVDNRYNAGGSDTAADLGADANWDNTTRNYLSAHPDTNVVIWSWCGQLCWYTTAHVNDYLNKMNALEAEYPAVTFVYMTGHAFNASYGLSGDGRTGTEAINTANNALIRNYCITNNKLLYDFEDIDLYDPSGNYYGDKHVTDGCTYDSNGNGTIDANDANWATTWQTANPTEVVASAGVEFHTYPANYISKGYAAWYLLCKIAGYNPTV